jgi:ribonuclease HI
MSQKSNFYVQGVLGNTSRDETIQAYSKEQAEYFFKLKFGFKYRIIVSRELNKIKKEEEFIMANKFYGVRVGVKPGVYNTWKECEEQVKGYPGATYKGFVVEQDAINYVGGFQEEELINQMRQDEEVLDSKVYYYSVDGSYNVKTGTYGGSFVMHKGTQILAKKGITGNDAKAAEGRNHAGELSAAMHAIQHAIAYGLKTFTIRYDYNGVGAFISGDWKAKDELSKKYKKWVEDKKKEHGLNITFVHVDGHTGDEFNELADVLAKKAVGVPIK